MPNAPGLERVRELTVKHFHERNNHRGIRFDVANLTVLSFACLLGVLSF
jgi:hypothetical protein